MLIGLFLFGGAATLGVLIAYLILAERELKEKRRRIEELQSKPVAASDSEIHTEDQIHQKFPEVEVAELKEENSRLSEQAAELGKERDAGQERIRQLEREQDRMREVEGQVAELKEENSRLLEQAAELGKERDAGQEKATQLEREQDRMREVEGQVTELREKNSQLLEQTNKLRSLILERLESQLAGLNGLYQQVSEADNSEST